MLEDWPASIFSNHVRLFSCWFQARANADFVLFSKPYILISSSLEGGGEKKRVQIGSWVKCLVWPHSGWSQPGFFKLSWIELHSIRLPFRVSCHPLLLSNERKMLVPISSVSLGRFIEVWPVDVTDFHWQSARMNDLYMYRTLSLSLAISAASNRHSITSNLGSNLFFPFRGEVGFRVPLFG